MKEMIISPLYLQMFADAGTVVNATGNYVNAYTGAAESFSGTNTLTGELKTFYDTELLENARVDMYYAQFAKTQPLPANHGTTVEWRKWNTFARADKLTEGVIPTGQKFGMSSKTGSINQYGTYATISDKLELHAYDDTILGATEEMGASAAETQEVLIRDALLVNTNVLYCDNINAERSDDGNVAGAYVSTPASPAQMGASYKAGATDGCYSLLTPVMVNKAYTKLKKDKVPTINGKYVAVIHPSVAFDIRSSKGWVDAHKYAATTELFNGEIGELHNTRFVVDTFAPVFKGEDLTAAARNLTVASVSVKTFTVDEAITAAEATALVGRKLCIKGVLYTVASCAAGAAGAATITVSETVTGAPGDGEIVYPGEGNKIGGATYATYFFGKDAYGIIDPEGGALEMIVHDKDEIGGPLNQFSTVGYKLETNGATVLYSERVLRVMSCSDYSAIDVAN